VNSPCRSTAMRRYVSPWMVPVSPRRGGGCLGSLADPLLRVPPLPPSQRGGRQPQAACRVCRLWVGFRSRCWPSSESPFSGSIYAPGRLEREFTYSFARQFMSQPAEQTETLRTSRNAIKIVNQADRSTYTGESRSKTLCAERAAKTPTGTLPNDATAARLLTAGGDATRVNGTGFQVIRYRVSPPRRHATTSDQACGPRSASHAAMRGLDNRYPCSTVGRNLSNSNNPTPVISRSR
jgi:hypothetical protein